MNRLDNAKSAKATDALLGYETVKYFNNEDFERANYEKVGALTLPPKCCNQSEPVQTNLACAHFVQYIAM